MTHLEALQSRAAERYAVKQLTGAELEAFEEHYFTCPECAEEVRWVSMFEANARKVVGQKVRELPAEFASATLLQPHGEAQLRLHDSIRKAVFTVQFPSSEWQARHVSLATGAGTARFTMSVPAEQLQAGAVTIVVPATELDPGRHVITLVSTEGEHLDYVFQVRFD